MRVFVVFSSSDVCRSFYVLVVRWLNCSIEKKSCSFSVCFWVVFVCVWTTIIMLKCIKCDKVLPVNRTFDTRLFYSDPSLLVYAISTWAIIHIYLSFRLLYFLLKLLMKLYKRRDLTRSLCIIFLTQCLWTQNVDESRFWTYKVSA